MDSGVEADVVELRDVDCPSWTCEHLTVIDCEYLVGCYGWDPVTLSFIGPDVPDELAAAVGVDCDCTDPEDSCTVDRGVVHLDGSEYLEPAIIDDSECICEEGVEGGPAPDKCCWDSDEAAAMALEVAYEEWQPVASTEDWLGEVVGDCGPEPDDAFDFNQGDCVVDPPQLFGELGEVCDPVDAASRVSGDYLLTIDPTGSYVRLQTPSDVEEFPVVGVGVAENAPASFLFAMADFDPGVFEESSYSYWRMWIDAPIDINVAAGTFSVPAAQGYSVFGRGKIDGELYMFEASPGTNATGSFDEDDWHLDFTQTAVGIGSIQVHLQGPLYATSTP